MACDGPEISDINEIMETVTRWNETATAMKTKSATAEWAWASNLTDYNQREKAKVSAEAAAFYKQIWKEAICINCDACDAETKRTVQFYSSIDESALPETTYDEVIEKSLTFWNKFEKKIFFPVFICPSNNARHLWKGQNL